MRNSAISLSAWWWLCEKWNFAWRLLPLDYVKSPRCWWSLIDEAASLSRLLWHSMVLLQVDSLPSFDRKNKRAALDATPTRESEMKFEFLLFLSLTGNIILWVMTRWWSSPFHRSSFFATTLAFERSNYRFIRTMMSDDEEEIREKFIIFSSPLFRC